MFMGRRSTIRNNLGELRERLSLRRREFANKLGLDPNGTRTPHLESIEKGARSLSQKMAQKCTVLFGVSHESILNDDGVLINTKGRRWTTKDMPRHPTPDDLYDLVISTFSEPSEVLDRLLNELRALEQMDLSERGIFVKRKLLEISRLARQLAKREEDLSKS
jgi:transcriptional regulator with XRE-family HTH domain